MVPSRVLVVEWARKVKLSPDVHALVSPFGPVASIAPHKKASVLVSFEQLEHAVAARTALHGQPCESVNGRRLFVHYHTLPTVPATPPKAAVAFSTAECGIPGLFLVTDFVGRAEERDLIALLDSHASEQRQHKAAAALAAAADAAGTCSSPVGEPCGEGGGDERGERGGGQAAG